jgi:hypothetical protein
MWQQGGSKHTLFFTAAKKYIHDLNIEKFIGYDDWRLPTLEEAMSLMKPVAKVPMILNDDAIHIDPVFDKTHGWIWTADKRRSGAEWIVDFSTGYCKCHDGGYFIPYVRAVRSGQSSGI